MITAAEIEDEELTDCTVVLDSVPFRFAITDPEYNSYKLKQKPAIVYQMACTMDSMIRFVDGGQPGSHHDTWCMARCIQSFQWHTVSSNDVVVTNGGYRDLSSYGINCAQPIRREGRMELSAADMKSNERLHTVQKRIERVFGALKTRFNLLRRPFHGTPARHAEIVTVLVAIYNKEHRIHLHLPHNF